MLFRHETTYLYLFKTHYYFGLQKHTTGGLGEGEQKKKGKEKYPNMSKCAASLTTFFGRIYLCEPFPTLRLLSPTTVLP